MNINAMPGVVICTKVSKERETNAGLIIPDNGGIGENVAVVVSSGVESVVVGDKIAFQAAKVKPISMNNDESETIAILEKHILAIIR